MNYGRILDIPSVKEVIEAVKIKIAPKKKVVKKAKKK